MRFTNVLSKKFRIDDVAEMTKKFSNLPDRFIRRKMEQVSPLINMSIDLCN